MLMTEYERAEFERAQKERNEIEKTNERVSEVFVLGVDAGQANDFTRSVALKGCEPLPLISGENQHRQRAST